MTLAMDTRTRECHWCHRRLPMSEYGLKADSRSRNHVCKDCIAVGHSCTRVERPKLPKPVLTEEEKQARKKAYQKAWREKNKDRAKKHARDWYARRKAVTKKDTYICRCCGRELPASAFTDADGRRKHGGKCRECRDAGLRKPRVGNGQGPRHEYFKKYFQERKHELKVKSVTRALQRARNVEAAKKKVDKLCHHCKKWPCFQGIETFETDFASCGCHDYRPAE